jgi:Asp-tRNA(Asn)/Glu-tRNA(Gln) amidotransferase B subunit
VPSQPESDALTAEALAVQVIEENPDTVKKYSGGDMAALSALQTKAAELAAGRIPEQELKNTLMRKLGASI